MKEKIITIADIQTRDILYYDPDLKDECYKFCKERNIDYLPALDGKHVYSRDENTQSFSEKDVNEGNKVSGTKNAFSSDMLEIFRRQPLRLVFENDELTGVVHFADYGKPVVSTYLYELFFGLERALRTILIQKNLGNDDMLAFFEHKASLAREKEEKNRYKRKFKHYNKHKDRNAKLPNLQTFYLSNLIQLAAHHGVVTISEGINKLRNMVMHAHELVDREDPHASDYIFEIGSFEMFFEMTLELQAAYRLVTNRIAFLEEHPHPHDHRP